MAASSCCCEVLIEVAEHHVAAGPVVNRTADPVEQSPSEAVLPGRASSALNCGFGAWTSTPAASVREQPRVRRSEQRTHRTNEFLAHLLQASGRLPPEPADRGRCSAAGRAPAGFRCARLDIRGQLLRRGGPGHRGKAAILSSSSSLFGASGVISRAACRASAKWGSRLRAAPYHVSSVSSAQRLTSASRLRTGSSPARARRSQSAYSLRSGRARSVGKLAGSSELPGGSRLPLARPGSFSSRMWQPVQALGVPSFTLRSGRGIAQAVVAARIDFHVGRLRHVAFDALRPRRAIWMAMVGQRVVLAGRMLMARSCRPCSPRASAGPCADRGSRCSGSPCGTSCSAGTSRTRRLRRESARRRDSSSR